MKKFVMAVVFLLLLIRTGEAKTLILSGIPDIQTKSSVEESIRIEVDSAKKKDLRVVIIKDGDQYYWETRDHKKLIRSVQGSFILFIDPLGGGYVKVIPLGGKVIYMEHLSQGLETFTYWGAAEHFEP
ncbi:MAG: hypothetical protein EPO39_07775 [Candidatus Manganitrophaceae bacterium]|nr:MAG: hypothetical protein EPO39_07775 [Candidatus Manganitrophaceae bacterium]